MRARYKGEVIVMDIEKLTFLAKEKGADFVSEVEVKDINFDIMFREICESKTCGAYGKSWMCPPHNGSIKDLIQKAQSYHHAFVFQMITHLEDSFDVEGMYEAGKNINDLARVLKNSDFVKNVTDTLVLGGGACRYCEVCAVCDSKACPYPDMAIASIESHGIDAMSLASAAGLNYMNGKDTVTFTGVILYNQ